MILWLLIAILAYLFFGLASFGDKLVLAGKPKPNSYTFYVGALGLFVVLLIPFVSLRLPNQQELIWVILDAIVHVAGLYTMFVALEKFEVSKVVSTIGATQPIFIFIFTCFFWGPQIIPAMDILAFVLLFLGSVVISFEKTPQITISYLKVTIFSSLMFSLDYIFSKFVFLGQSFLPGVIWIRIFVFLFVLVLLISKKSRQDIFCHQLVSDKKTQISFFCAQAFGGIANFLQSLAISLAPIIFLATVNSLRGIQYVFLFIITLFFSYFFPRVLKEELSKRIIIQKVVSIILIVAGLAILVAY
ncbi:MAG: EamA family transporter [Candidatus Staskawiczbacteria bacterium]|nr:EamA family transporter [Candidatus Staskawiczbacteria bacterium]